MNRLRRVVNVLFLVSITAGQFSAQLKSPLAPIEPFSIKSGSTFSASGGSAGGGFGVSSTLSRVAADIREAEAIIARNYVAKTVKPETLIESAVTGMLRTLDPHSNFHNASAWKELLDEQHSGYSGIGTKIANFENDGTLETYILSTVPGSPAAKARLRFGDRVVAINDEKMSELSSDAVRDKIRGSNGTTFRLTIERADTLAVETLEISRSRVPQPSIPDAYILRPGVGYIDLTEGFNYTTAVEFDGAMKNLKRLGMRSLILDLRGNGGGIVDQAVKVAERFLPAGTLILSQRGRSRMDNREWKSANVTPETMPLVVLVDEETASASEIVAGAFQDDDRALIVGEKTFGKGLVQSVIDLPGKNGLTLTTARYLTPSGRSIQRDYSNGDMYDYFSHKTPSASIDRPFFEARTITDRKVFGGDGILPDEIVKGDRINAVELTLIDPIFQFSRALAGRMTAPLDTKTSTGNGLQVSHKFFEEFEIFALSENRNSFSPQVLRDNSSFIRLRIRYYLAMWASGTEAARQVLIGDDDQVDKALSALPRARELTELATKTIRASK